MGKFSNFIKRVTSSKGFSRVELVTQNNSNFFYGATRHMILIQCERVSMHRL